MKVYKLVWNDGSVGKIYTTREEAQKAFDWYKSLPSVPEDNYEWLEKIVEEEVDEKFTPWISDECIAVMQKNHDEYVKELEERAEYEEYINDLQEAELKEYNDCEECINSMFNN